MPKTHARSERGEKLTEKVFSNWQVSRCVHLSDRWRRNVMASISHMYDGVLRQDTKLIGYHEIYD